MEITFVFKGKSATQKLADATGTDDLFAAAEALLGLEDQKLKILYKGKQLSPGVALAASPLAGVAAAKCMVMATGVKEVSAVQAARSDPTVRGFASEDAAAAHHKAQQSSEELSEWGRPQDATYRFCRFQPCTWQSFGTRPSSSTPHAFEARALLVKLAQDPGVVAIMREREYTVGVLAEMDPLDDRLAEKASENGGCLLGYNANHGAEVHVRMRTDDLSGFKPYRALIDTLLHELAHNEVGPHNDQFWHLFAQLKADYLRTLRALSARGELFGGGSALSIAQVADEAADVRSAVIMALSEQTQMLASPLQVELLDGYLGLTGGAAAGTAGHTLGGMAEGGSGGASGAGGGAMSAAERRELLAARAAARIGAQGAAPAADCFCPRCKAVIATAVTPGKVCPQCPMPTPAPPPPAPPKDDAMKDVA